VEPLNYLDHSTASPGLLLLAVLIGLFMVALIYFSGRNQ
jgi:hypothetical protein